VEKYWYAATVERIIDGDTVDVNLSLGFDVSVKQRLRLYGINAPETHGVKKTSDEYQRGMAATEFLEEMIGNKEVLVHTHKDETGKFGRYLAEIYVVNRLGGRVDINKAMINNGYAVEYYGGKR